ncbi:hypothetical protein ACFLTA_03630 [Bacteroidota bacterium]
MKTISLNIDDIIFKETEEVLSVMKKSRNKYINEAIDYFNQYQKRLILEKKLKKESTTVGEESMNILKDFEDIDYGD